MAGYRLSPQQSRIWSLMEASAGQPFRARCALVLEGDLDEEALARGLSDLVRHNEILRTRYERLPGTAMQVIKDAVPVDLARLDWSDRGEAGLDARIAAYFDDGQDAMSLPGPVFRPALARVAQGRHVLLIDMPALCADRGALAALARTICRAYAARVRGEALSGPDSQYADVAEVYNDLLESPETEAGRRRWLECDLSTMAAAAILSESTTEPRTFAPGRVCRTLAPAVDLDAAAARARSTVAAFLLACWQHLLHRLSGQPSWLVAVARSGRSDAGLDDALGAFERYVPLRGPMDPDGSFADLLDHVDRATAQAEDWQHYFDMARHVPVLPGRSGPPCLPFGFAALDWPQQLAAPGLAITVAELHARTERFDIELECARKGSVIEARFHYDAGRYAAEDIARLAERFDTLVRDAARHSARRLAELAIVGDEEQRLLSSFQGTTRDWPLERCIHELIQDQARRTPEAVAVVFADQRLTYAELEARANCLAHHLRGLGVAPEVRVGLCIERSTDMIVAILGALKAGGAYVPLDPTLPGERLAFMMEAAGVELVVTSSALRSIVPARQARIICLDDDAGAIAAQPESPPDERAGPDSLAYVIFTSGSTGRPNGVMVEHRSVVNLAHALHEAVYEGRRAGLRVSLNAPLAFDASVKQWIQLARGHALYIVPDEVRLDPARLVDFVRCHALDVLDCTPTQLGPMLAHGLGREPAVCPELALVGGEAVDERLWAALAGSSHTTFYNVYGPTECTVDATACAVRASSRPTIGQPLGNVRVYLLDAELRRVPMGGPGEICIAGTGVSRGYARNARLTTERFLPDPYGPPGSRLYRTGDLGRYRRDGCIEFLGRRDHQVKVRGFRIELGEIEAALVAHPAIAEAVAVVRDDAPGTARIVAYLVPRSLPAPGVGELRRVVQERLPEYMIPQAFVVLDALPLTHSGKIDRRALPAPDARRSGLEEAFVEPRSPVERALAAIWSRVLGIERVGAEDNFFALGGNSLSSVEASFLARQQGLPVSPRLLFQHQTITRLAQALAGADLDAGEPAGPGDDPWASRGHAHALRPLPAERHQPFPMTDLQQAYWVGRQHAFELGDAGPSSYVELEYEALDVARLEEVWQRLVARHDMLRAVVLPEGELRVLETAPRYRIAVHDLGGCAPAQVREELDAIRERMSHQTFRPDTWPLFEIRATRLPGGRTRVHVSRDLIITDARGSHTLLHEMTRLYADPDAAWPELEVTFRDYAVMLASAGHDTQAAAEYWRLRLPGLPPPPPLPGREGARAGRGLRFVNRRTTLDRHVWSELKKQSAAADLTPSALLCAAFAEVLATWSGTAHFTINLMYSDRRPVHPQIGQVVGNFGSTLLLEVNGRGATFAERARTLQGQLWEDLGHSEISGVRVLRELNAMQGSHARASAPIVFSSVLPVASSLAEHGRNLSLPGGVAMVHSSVQTPQVTLEAVVHELDDILHIAWNARDDLFPQGLVTGMFEAYHGLISALAHDDTRWHARRRDLVPAAALEARAVVNATAAPMPAGLLHHPFLAQAAEQPHAPAIVAPARTISYGELDELSAQVAAELGRLGAGPGDLVAVIMEKHWAQVVAVLGVLRAGAAYVPLEPSLPASRLGHVLSHARVRHALTTTSANERVAWPDDIVCVCVDTAAPGPRAGTPGPADHAADPGSLAYVIYTSGSTGLPKGVMIDHRGALNTIVDINRRFRVAPGDRVLALSALSFDLSVYDIFGALAAGATIVMPEAAPAPAPDRWLAHLRDDRVTVLNAVPALVEILVEHAWSATERDLGALRLVLMSGDWIPVTLPDRVRALQPGARQVSLGGATEASIWSVFHPIETVDPSWVSIPYGRPLSNQGIHVLDHALEPCPVWTTGMIYLSGIGLAKGYLGDEEKTRAVFVQHPDTGERLYRTGDLGRWLPGGEVELLGREDFQVKIQGYRVEIAEIEAVLAQDPAVAAAAVCAVGELRGAKRLAGFAVPAPGAELDEDRLAAIARARLPGYMVPATFVILPALPLTTNGKIDRQALAALDAGGVQPVPVELPRDDVEQALVRLFAEILGVASIGIYHDFFALGGNSLLALRLMTRIERELGARLPLSSLFSAPTIARLADMLRHTPRASTGSPLVSMKSGASRPPFFCVHPVGGGVLCFTDLARHMDEERAMYALEARGLEGELMPIERIEDMAALYVDAVRKAQPHGPYFLGGWSMGAIVALEMGQVLRALGEEIGLVALIDPPLPRAVPDLERKADDVLLRMMAADLGRTAGQDLQAGEPAAGLAPDERFERFMDEARARDLLPRDIDANQVRRLLAVFRAHTAALSAHVPRPYGGRVLLVQARDRGHDRDTIASGWARLIPDLIVESIPGDHYTLLREPHVRQLAWTLRAHLPGHVPAVPAGSSGTGYAGDTARGARRA